MNQLSVPLQPEPATSSVHFARDVLIVAAVTLALRIPYFRWRMFPLNDGGMFAQIIDDIRASHFLLPIRTTYNFLDIPLSYPPLAFYLGAFCALITGHPALLVLTWLPLILNVFTIVLLYFIAKELYPSSFYACLAACCYALIGRSGEWLTMGGGLTRGLGLLFALLAILLFLRSKKRDSTVLAAWSGFCVGLAILSHLEGGIFAVLSLIVLSVLLPKRPQSARIVLAAGAIAMLSILPWMIWVYLHLGLGPLMNAAQTGGSYRSYPNYAQLALLFASIILLIAAKFPYFSWLAVIPFAMRRSGPTYTAPIAGLCIVWVANAIFVLLARRCAWARRWSHTLIVVFAVAFSLPINGLPHIRSDRLADLRLNARAQLSRAEVTGMQTAATLSPTDAKFFVFNQRIDDWPIDMVAEWFPYLAQRRCINTVQGREWLPNRAFFRAIERTTALEFSASPTATAIILDDLKPDYIFIAGPLDNDHIAAANTLREYAGSLPIYKNDEVEIYKVARSGLSAPKTN